MSEVQNRGCLKQLADISIYVGKYLNTDAMRDLLPFDKRKKLTLPPSKVEWRLI
ncbi:MAG: hypothetical protein M3Q16_04105 [Pseudomonadota bacterium]|nr:hypothetical protein [Pseudomonadota bacterium]